MSSTDEKALEYVIAFNRPATEEECFEWMLNFLKQKWGTEEIIRRCTVVVGFDGEENDDSSS